MFKGMLKLFEERSPSISKIFDIGDRFFLEIKTIKGDDFCSQAYSPEIFFHRHCVTKSDRF